MNIVKFGFSIKCNPGRGDVIYSKELAKSNGSIILVSGPSGVGKGTMITQLFKDPEIKFLFKNALSVTTRKPRPGENPDLLQKLTKLIKKLFVPGFFKDNQATSQQNSQYRFVSHKKFIKLKETGKLFDFTCYDGNWYGTDLPRLIKQLKKGFNVLIELSSKEALKIKSYYPDKALAIFISPPAPELDTLRKRLEKRGTNSADSIRIRLERAAQEMKLKAGFDEIIINEDNQLEKAVKRLKEMILLKLKGLLNKESKKNIVA